MVGLKIEILPGDSREHVSTRQSVLRHQEAKRGFECCSPVLNSWCLRALKGSRG